MSVYEDVCPTCGEINNINRKTCKRCFINHPRPFNVRRASLKDEVAEVMDRYYRAKTFLHENGLSKEQESLEFLVIEAGRAIINTQLEFIWNWLVDETEYYQSYQRQIIEEKRERAIFENDSPRCAIDSLLFSSNYDNIYAALTTDETGLQNYGEVAIILKNLSVANRTSALEKNSYQFVSEISEAGWKITDPLPKGFLTTWPNKHYLAVAKLQTFLFENINDSELSRLILSNSKNRMEDIFIELYIDGSISPENVDKIVVPEKVIKSLKGEELLKFKELERKYQIKILS